MLGVHAVGPEHGKKICALSPDRSKLVLCGPACPQSSCPALQRRVCAMSACPRGAESLVQPESSDSEEEYDLQSGVEDWYYGKSHATIQSYRVRLSSFRRFLADKHHKDLPSARRKHVRAFLAHVGETNSQVRPHLCVLKSLYKILMKLGVVRKDPTLGFKIQPQLPPKVERNLRAADIRRVFSLVRQRRDKSTFAMLQVLVYAGLRVSSLVSLRCADVIESDGDVHFIRVRKAKGSKTRWVYLRKDIGAALCTYAAEQSRKSVYMFPGRNPRKPITRFAVHRRLKTLGRRIGCPAVSAHWFRHFFASQSLRNGCDLATLSEQMGHSDLKVTSVYCHPKPGQSASSFITDLFSVRK